MGIRLAAVLMLLLQLNQLAVPALCGAAQRSPAACPGAPTPGAPQLTGANAAHHVPCADGAMCGVVVTGIPESAITLVAPDGRRVEVQAAPTLHSGDPAPPLSPPPQT